MAIITGTGGNDNVHGTEDGDLFKLGQGGNDKAHGKAGDDEFRLGGTLTADDIIDGGTGNDTLLLEGDPSGPFGADTITNIEVMKLTGDFHYTLFTDDGNVAAGMRMTIDGRDIGTDHEMQINGSNEHDGSFSMFGSAGNDRLVGSHNNDKFSFVLGGEDIANGGEGRDSFTMGQALDAADKINGGQGFDTMSITFTAAIGALTLTAATLTNIEKLVVKADGQASIATDDGTVAAGKTFIFDGSACVVTACSLDGSQETDGHFDLTGGGSEGVLYGGAQSDVIRAIDHEFVYFVSGGGGADDITCAAGGERVTYGAQSESTGADGHDLVHGFNANQDKFDLNVTLAAFQVNGPVASIDNATFDDDLGDAFDDGLTANGGYLVTVNGGDLIGHQLLVVDTNGNITYDAGTDYVIDITGFTGTLDAADFI